jgi:hypothetical protein
MRKLTYFVLEDGKPYGMEFITDRTPSWTEEQYQRHRTHIVMELVSDEETEETKPVSREVELG